MESHNTIFTASLLRVEHHFKGKVVLAQCFPNGSSQPTSGSWEGSNPGLTQQ